jgi:putative membrane protein
MQFETPPLPIELAGRLHPLTLIFGVLRGLRGALPLVPALFFSSRWVGVGLIALFLLGATITALARYFSFSYRIEGGELVTREGLLARKQRNIPLERVQEIRIEQGVLQRLLGVVEAQVETGGGGGPEATLSVLARAEAERLRQAVFERVAARKAQAAGELLSEAAPVVAPVRLLVRQLSLRELALAGLTSNHLVSALVIVGALWGFADDLLPASFYERVAEASYRVGERLLAQGAVARVLLAVLGALLVFVVGMIFSVLGSIALFYGFTFSRSGDDLLRHYGLFTRRASSLPRCRIQVLEIEEKLLRRLCGLVTLRADTSGSQRSHEDNNEGRDVLLPLARRAEVPGLLPVFFPDLDTEPAQWRRVSRLAIRRGMVKGGLFCLLAATALLGWRRDWTGLLPLALLPLIYGVCVAQYRTLGYALGERYLRTRRGWLGRSTHIVPLNKVQAVELAQTPFERRLGLATLSVDTAGQAYTGGGPQISNLPVAEARALAYRLAQQAAATRYRV